MTDRSSDQAAVTPAEGVRILGAEEAQVALSNDQGVLNLSREEEVENGGDSRNRDVAYPDSGPSWSAAPEAADSTAEVPPLPHWTEPPTGAVPAIFSDDTGEHNELDEDLDVWAPVTGAQPRFRSEGSDWADADFADDLSDSGEHGKLGALDEQGPVDEEAAFAEALDRKRKRPVRRARAPKAAVPAGVPAAAAAATAPRPRPQQPRPAPNGELAPAGPSQSRDLPTAVLTALIVAIGALICFKQGPAWTTALAALVVGVAALEFCAALRSKGLRTATLLAFVAALTIPVAAYNYGTNAYPMFFGLVAVFTMLWFLWEVTPGRPLIGVATTVLAFAYVGGLGGFSGLLLARPSGVGLILGVVLCVIAYDVAGFFVGSQWGRTPIAPRVSPNKSVQGTVGGMAASIFIGTVLVGQIHPWDAKWGFLLGCLVAIGAFLGDLCESMIKRDIGLKDFGTLLPGHGGVLDRFDGLLFCLPIAYYLAVAAKLV